MVLFSGVTVLNALTNCIFLQFPFLFYEYNKMLNIPVWLSGWIDQHNIFRFQVGMDQSELLQFQQSR